MTISSSIIQQATSAALPTAHAQSRFNRHNEEFQKKMSNPEMLLQMPCYGLRELELITTHKEHRLFNFVDEIYRFYNDSQGTKTSSIVSNTLTNSNSIFVSEKVPHTGEHDMQLIDQVILALHT